MREVNLLKTIQVLRDSMHRCLHTWHWYVVARISSHFDGQIV